MKFGLLGIRSLCAELGNPHKSFTAVHVAGSNGKGSTAAMIAAILRSAGFKTGLYTSPHLLDYSERIRINGVPIRRREVIDSANELAPIVRKTGATFFETTTAIAFKHFADFAVDVAVVETGLGGRLDSTNIVYPAVTVITTISREHTDILGKTLSEIAYEKAGIIKTGVACVTGVRSATALQIIKEHCRRKRAPLVPLAMREAGLREMSVDGTRVDLSVNGEIYSDLKISLAGCFQVCNAGLSLLAIRELSRKASFEVTDEAVREGLARTQELTGLHSRLSVISRDPLIIADVAHNAEATQGLVKALHSIGITGISLVFGVMRDKNVRTMSRELLKIAKRVILVQPRTQRARSALELVQFFKQGGIEPIVAGPVSNGVDLVKELEGREGPILITGSHFVVAEALAHIRGRKYLTIDQ